MFILMSLITTAASGSNPIKVITVGDSITVTSGDESYPSQLRTLLGPAYTVSNQGDSGHTMLINGACGATPAGSWRHPCLPMPPSNVGICSGNCSYWGSDQFLNTTDPASAPDIITIMLGTNDAKYCNWNGPINGEPVGAGTQFAADYVKMVKLFKALPSKPKVFVVLPPPGISQCKATGPAGSGSVCLAYNMSFTAINEIFPVLQRQIATDSGADGVIDVWGALNGTTCTTGPLAGQVPPCPDTVDGIHPYPDSLAVIAATIAKAITASSSSNIIGEH
jgi:lysophospholipase L1-like esterase